MPRLTSLEPNRDERGVVAIFVALILVFLLGLVALGAEGGQMWADKERTQNAADAAALAIASACASGDCGDIDQIAATYASGNGAQKATATLDGNTVTVTASTHNVYLFGAFLGSPEGTVISKSTATSAPLTGTATLPYAVTECAWNHRGDTDQVIRLDGDTDCPDGGFTYLPSDDTCQVVSTAGDTENGQAGSTCGLDGMDGATILVPVLSGPTGGTRTVEGIAAFQLTGWCTTTGSYNTSGYCGTNNQQLRGHFVTYVATQSGQTDDAGADFGVTGVRLT